MSQRWSDTGPEAFLTLDAADLAEQPPDSALPILHPDAIAAAVVDRDRRVQASSAAYDRLDATAALDPELIHRASAGAAPQIGMVQVGPDALLPFAYARASETAHWRLPEPVRQAALRRPSDIVVVTGSTELAGQPLELACATFGLTPQQTRVALEVIRRGDTPSAAAALGLSPHTVRETLEAVKTRLRAPKLPAMVLQLASQGFGVLPGDADIEALTDIWGLTPRQAAIACLVASGLTRREAARALTLSEAVVKKELDQVFDILQVGTSIALSRRFAEARSMAWLMRATEGEVGFLDPVAEPLQFVRRPDGSRIAISDYGPRGGRPVIVSHSSLTTRPVPRALLRALHAAGYRPIAIDRPGFGLTELTAPDEDPFVRAARDAVHVLDHLRIRHADLVARSAAGFALALHEAAPERLGAVVLVNPGLTARDDRRKTGFWGLLKASYARNPRMIEAWVTYLSRQITPERHRALMRRWLAGSAADEAAMLIPGVTHDYFLAQRMFATGSVAGYVAEGATYLATTEPAPRSGTGGWRVVVGAQDTIHDPGDVLDHWRRILPDAGFELAAEAGRLLPLSHPELIVEALRRRG